MNIPQRPTDYGRGFNGNSIFYEITRMVSCICTVFMVFVLKLQDSLPQKLFNLVMSFFLIFFGILMTCTSIFTSYALGTSRPGKKVKYEFFLSKYWKTIKNVNQASFTLISSLFLFSIALYISSDIIGILISSETFTFQKFVTLFAVFSIPVILYFNSLYSSFQIILPFLNIFILIVFLVSAYLATSVSQQSVFSPVINRFAIISTLAVLYPACTFVKHQTEVIQKAQANKSKFWPVAVSLFISWLIFMLIGNLLYVFGGIADTISAILNVGQETPSGVFYTISKNSYLGFLIQVLIVTLIGINILGSFDTIFGDIKKGVAELGNYLYQEYLIPALIIGFMLTIFCYLYYIWLTEGIFQMSYIFITKCFLPIVVVGVPFIVGFTGLISAWGMLVFIFFFVFMFLGLLGFAGYLSYTGYFTEIIFSVLGFTFQIALLPLKLFFGGLSYMVN